MDDSGDDYGSLAGCGGKDDTAKTAAGQEHAEDTTDAKENKVDKGHRRAL